MLLRKLLILVSLLGISTYSSLAGGVDDGPKETSDGLPSKWKKMEEIPLPGTSAPGNDRLTVWVEKGWLVVRRETKGGELEWQIVLAQATDPKPPQLKIDKISGALS